MAPAKHHFKGSYVRRFEEMLAAPAYRDLSTKARCLLEEFQRIYRPGRNGDLSISTRRAAKLLGISEPTAGPVFYELASHGFIKLTDHQVWQERRARKWRVTFEKSINHAPTNDWKRWDPANPFPVPGRKKTDPKNDGSLAQKSAADC